MISMRGGIAGLELTSAKKLLPLIVLAAWAGIEVAWLLVHRFFLVGIAPVVYGTLILISISIIYRLSGRSKPLSEMSYYAALWVLLTAVGGVFTYIFATLNRPLLDVEFAKIDLAMGFHWLRFYAFVQSHHLVGTLLTIAYYSSLVQIFFSIIFLSHIGRDDRNDELWWTSLIALVLTSVLSGLFPAGGTLFYYSIGLDNAVHLPHFLALRDGRLTELVLGDLKGIVTFPSYHTVMALLLIYVYRKLPIFPWIVALNILMLISTPINGGHYLVDMIGGAAVAALSIVLTKSGNVFFEQIISTKPARPVCT